MPEYTALTLLAVVVVVVLDLVVVRTRLLTTAGFWVTLAIMWAFQFPVDGWLTRLEAPIVRYDEAMFSSVRIGWDSPIEDFGFGFAMVLATLMTYQALGPRRRASGRERTPSETAGSRPARDTSG